MAENRSDYFLSFCRFRSDGCSGEVLISQGAEGVRRFGIYRRSLRQKDGDDCCNDFALAFYLHTLLFGAICLLCISTLFILLNKNKGDFVWKVF